MSKTDIFVVANDGDLTVAPNGLSSILSSLVDFADFNKIPPGYEAECCKTITTDDVENFARFSGDENPLHMNESFAQRTHFQRRVVHGMLIASYVSALVGMHCPGPGALWSQQNFRWPSPVFIGDRIRLKLRVTHKSAGARALTIEVKGINQDGKVVMEGEGIVTVLEERVSVRDTPVGESVAFVNGVSSRIGAAIVRVLAQAGASVAVNCHGTPAAAEELCASIESKGGHAMPVYADIADYDSVVSAVCYARDKFSRPVNILINNSTAQPDLRPFVQLTWKQIQDALDEHLRSAFYCCQAVIPGMCEQKSGRIINIGSTFARNTPPVNWSSFVVAKSALQALTRSLASELGPQGIRVNMVSPGLVESESIAGMPDRMQRVQAMQTPLRRLASPADIASVVLALVSDAGNFITGTDIPVGGGFQA